MELSKAFSNIEKMDDSASDLIKVIDQEVKQTKEPGYYKTIEGLEIAVNMKEFENWWEAYKVILAVRLSKLK